MGSGLTATPGRAFHPPGRCSGPFSHPVSPQSSAHRSSGLVRLCWLTPLVPGTPGTANRFVLRPQGHGQERGGEGGGSCADRGRPRPACHVASSPSGFWAGGAGERRRSGTRGQGVRGCAPPCALHPLPLGPGSTFSPCPAHPSARGLSACAPRSPLGWPCGALTPRAHPDLMLRSCKLHRPGDSDIGLPRAAQGPAPSRPLPPPPATPPLGFRHRSQKIGDTSFPHLHAPTLGQLGGETKGRNHLEEPQVHRSDRCAPRGALPSGPGGGGEGRL